MGRFWCLAVLLVALTPAPGHAKECPSEMGWAPGVSVPERAGCVVRRRGSSRAAKPAPVRAGREPGFIDAGNGLQVRISGQADFEAGARRR